jgi:hypothetical protein
LLISVWNYCQYHERDLNNNDSRAVDLPYLTFTLVHNIGNVATTTVTDSSKIFPFVDVSVGNYIIIKDNSPRFTDMSVSRGC